MRRDSVLLADMLRFARQARHAGHGLSAEQLEADANRQAMILWPLTLLGEAAAHVSDTFRGAHPEIPWRRIVGLRNTLVHDYTGVDMVAVVQVLQRHVPELIDQLVALGADDSNV